MSKASGSGTIRGNLGQDDNYDDRDDYYDAQDLRYDEPSPRTGTQFLQQSMTSASGSRSASFTKNGKSVSVAESDSGITVTVDGKRVRAKDADELKNRYPDAYRLYDEGLKGTRSSARGFARGGGSAGGGGSSQSGSSGKFSKNSSDNRSISVVDNGKKVSITENKTGITVAVNGRRVRAKDAAELEAKFPEAFRMYEKHLGAAAESNIGQLNATDILRDELSELRDQNAGDPQLRSLIDRMLRNVPQ